MIVNIFYEDTKILDLSPEFFVLWLTKLCHIHGKTLDELNLIVCSNNYLLDVNRKHLNHDYYTDIITFDYCEDDKVAGDLFVSIDMVEENATKYNVSRETELHRVIAHGVLHLIGFNDKLENQKSVMRKKEEEALNLIVSRET